MYYQIRNNKSKSVTQPAKANICLIASRINSLRQNPSWHFQEQLLHCCTVLHRDLWRRWSEESPMHRAKVVNEVAYLWRSVSTTTAGNLSRHTIMCTTPQPNSSLTTVDFITLAHFVLVLQCMYVCMYCTLIHWWRSLYSCWNVSESSDYCIPNDQVYTVLLYVHSLPVATNSIATLVCRPKPMHQCHWCMVIHIANAIQNIISCF